MRFKGFTLSELLIALVILGLIATFTIPKVLSSQQSSQSKAIAKEAAGFVSEAFVIYKSQNAVTATTTFGDLTPFMNYVKIETAINVDHKETLGSVNCSGSACLKLHNGAVLWYDTVGGWSEFGGTNPTNCMLFLVDPDGVYGGSTTGPSKSVEFCLYTNSMLRTRGTLAPGSACGAGALGADPTEDPGWFGWD